MSNQTWTYIAIGVGRRRLADRVGRARARARVDVVLAACGSGSSRPCSALYVLAAFVLVGLLLGGGFLWYFDEL